MGEATPTTLAAELPFPGRRSPSTAVLTRAGLVESRKHVRVRFTVRAERVDAAARALASAAAAMAAAAARWDQRLNAIKRLAEAQAPAESAPDPGPQVVVNLPGVSQMGQSHIRRMYRSRPRPGGIPRMVAGRAGAGRPAPVPCPARLDRRHLQAGGYQIRKFQDLGLVVSQS
jgi:hypothetical protein